MRNGIFMKKITSIKIYFALVLFFALIGCGGGGGGPQPENQLTVNPSATLIKGFYKGSTDSGEIVSIVTPEADFYALHFRSLTNPDIYTSKLTMELNGVAISSGTGLLSYKSGYTQPGTARLTGGSLQAYAASLNMATELPLLFMVSAPVSTDYLISNEASLSALHGDWLGTWSDGLNTTSQFTIAISELGAMTLSTARAVNFCPLVASMQPMTGANIFAVTLTMASSTGCVRTKDKPNGIVLNGTAVVYKSPASGKNSRLDLVVVDLMGSGISFRGDR